jgi:hypothetical protein
MKTEETKDMNGFANQKAISSKPLLPTIMSSLLIAKICLYNNTHVDTKISLP